MPDKSGSEDDASGPTPFHRADLMLRAKERTRQIRLDCFAPTFRRDRIAWGHFTQRSGIVETDVQPAKLPLCKRYQCLGEPLIAHIARKELRFAAETADFCCKCSELVVPSCTQNHIGSRSRKEQRRGSSDPGAGTSDDRSLVFQAKHLNAFVHVKLSSLLSDRGPVAPESDAQYFVASTEI